jgi:hypothetical protein
MKSYIFWACCLLHAGFLFALFFDPEDGGNMFLCNVGYFCWTTWHYIPEDRTLSVEVSIKAFNCTTLYFVVKVYFHHSQQ